LATDEYSDRDDDFGVAGFDPKRRHELIKAVLTLRTCKNFMDMCSFFS
jgi:hypothetical protein